MQHQIHIPEPCSEKWNKMKVAGEYLRHCDVCKHSVHDFSKASFSEISKKVNASGEDKLCGRYHERHTNDKRIIYHLANVIDNALSGTRIKRLSLLFISAILLFSGCARRHVQGKLRVSFDGSRKNNGLQTEQTKI